MRSCSLKTFTFSLLSSLLLVGTLHASEIPGRVELNLESSVEDIEKFLDLAFELSASEWPELAALGELALSIGRDLEAGDEEGFVAKQAVFNLRESRFSEEVRLEMLRIQISGVQCSCPAVIEKGCSGGGSGNPNLCSTNLDCADYCYPGDPGACDGSLCICD